MLRYIMNEIKSEFLYQNSFVFTIEYSYNGNGNIFKESGDLPICI